MGTSGAYGGTSGWQGVSDQTQEWLEGPSTGGSSGGSGDGDEPPVDGPASEPQAPPGNVPEGLAQLLQQLGRRLASEVPNIAPGTSAGRSRGGGGGGGAGGGGSNGGGSRSVSRASRAGARAVGGAYGLRAGVPGLLAEIGLTLAELEGLSTYAQAERILDAATGPTGAIDQTEQRQANAELVIWALNQESPPTPVELADRWVVEYVWQVWITEAGPLVNRMVENGNDRIRIEQEMRAALEASVSANALPTGRPLTTDDFQAAIRSALESLGRIGGAAA